ncbi:MAG: patatin-like phospholipase family protein [Hyphomicrobiaceae bacterium]
MADARPKSKMYLALEGGGAKGVAHVGALYALDAFWSRPRTPNPQLQQLGKSSGASEFELHGVSGTSIGALIAALIACGYSAREILDKDSGKSPLLERVGIKSRRKVFGSITWWKIRFIRSASIALNNRWFRLLAFLILVGALAASYYASWLLSAVLGPPLWAAAWLFLALFLARWAARGICSTSHFSSVLNRALAVGLARTEAERDELIRNGVRFKDIHSRTGLSLRIVATNIDTKSLHLFSELDSDGSIRVAEAVCASIAIPLLFRPVTVRLSDGPSEEKSARFYDGALVSNLPAWAFDRERAVDPDARVVALEIPDHLIPPQKARALKTGGVSDTLGRSMRAALFGARMLEKTFMDRLMLIRADTSASLLHFNMPARQIKSFIEDAEAVVRQQFRVRAIDNPIEYQNACRKISSQLRLILDCEAGDIIRVRLARRVDGEVDAYQVNYADFDYGMFTDDRLVLPDGASIAGGVGHKNRFDFIANPLENPNSLPGLQNRYNRALRWRDAKWMLFIPVASLVKRRDVKADMVIIIDGNTASEQARQIFDENSTNGVKAMQGFADIVNLAMEKEKRLDEETHRLLRLQR